MFKERLEHRILEYSYGVYYNPWFLVAKKEKGTYWLVVTVIYINKVIIHDANMPSNVDKFSKEFTRYIVALLLNIFLGYN
jgi:hypothetical protein